ncbi:MULTISPECIES: ABC transporter ATP-binding protein [unclassified Pseudoalteromonas]|uniref:ABC transporter ATP-binding protein n=1 Tax=unclassified Pseudoalteromonas TaxID=194690 RepID=UPI00209822D1|nr:ABC transporter ATP-binding protein [Pseudoalteromonas sp. XMcav2-N]MCO7190944.1 ABC transporter ATP-binding protein/permease [Pseudoalteromonas sp. XMcav2-N]
MKPLFTLFEKIGHKDTFDSQLHEAEHNLSFIRQCAKEFSGWIAVAFIISLLGGLLQIVTFDFLGELVDWLDTSGDKTQLNNKGYQLALFAVAIAVVIPALTLVKNLVFHQLLGPNLQKNTIVKLYRTLIASPASYHEEDDPGSTAIVIVDTSEAIIDVVLQFCGFAGFLLAFLGALLFYVGNIDGWLTLPFLIWTGLFLAMLLGQWIPNAKTTNRLEAESCAQITGKLTERFARIRTVKMLSGSEYEQQFAEKWATRHRRVVAKEFRVFSHFASVVGLLNGTLIVGTGALCLQLWLNGSISVGEFSMVLALVYRVISLSEWCQEEFDAFFVSWGQVTVGREVINEFLEDIEPIEDAGKFNVCRGKITFKNVEFAYENKASLFTDLSLKIKAGEKVGIIGPSGAGKSSLLNMLAGIDEIEEGAIYIDGKNIEDYPTDQICGEISFLNQDIGLFNQSIYENVAFGLNNVSRASVRHALEQANALEFVEAYTDARGRKGLSAFIGENGGQLSGGQRQRLALARAILRDKKILLLDEATSALDPALKAEFIRSLKTLMKGKTVISVAHSYDVLAMMDRIIEIKDGKIIRDGKPADVIDAVV